MGSGISLPVRILRVSAWVIGILWILVGLYALVAAVLIDHDRVTMIVVSIVAVLGGIFAIATANRWGTTRGPF